jgi:Rieske 2Fe-2S family protein
MTATRTGPGSLRPPAAEEKGPPKSWFLDREWFERDLAAIHRPRWQLAGHVTELAEPGRLLTYSLGAEEALIRTDEHGELRAYHNVCAHRGARLCRERTGRTSSRRIVCPYHGWSYSPSDGSLVTAASMHEDFDRSPWGLRPVHVDVWRGLIFVCFADERPQPVAERFGDRPWGGYDDTRLKVAATKSHVVRANWKIVAENDFECYHCVLNHPELITTFDWKVAANDDFDGFVRARAAGREIEESVMDSPLTVNGEQVCRVPLPRHDDEAHPSAYMLGWEPDTGIALAPDHGWAFAPKPLAPDLTEVRQYWLVAEAATEGVDYERDSLTRYWDATMQQDRELCERVQEGMRMPAYAPGPLNRVHQTGQAGFYAWYAEQIRRRFPREAEIS